MSKHLSDPERLRIIEEYLSGNETRYSFAKKRGIPSINIKKWMIKFGLEETKYEPMKTSESNTPSTSKPLSISEEEELKRLRKENRILKAQLKREALGHKAYKMLVDLAEETYGIEIRKNSAAK